MGKSSGLKPGQKAQVSGQYKIIKPGRERRPEWTVVRG
jgi:hypothetical protein